MATHRPTWRLEVKSRPEGSTGFTPLRQRWVVERTNAWNGRDRRNSKDYERKPTSSAVMIQMSNINLMLNRLSPRLCPAFRYRQKRLESLQRGGEVSDSLSNASIHHFQRDKVLGRYEGTDKFLGRRGYPLRGSAIVTHVMMEPQDVFGAATSVGTRIQKSSQDTTPSADNARNPKAEKNEKTAHRGSLFP